MILNKLPKTEQMLFAKHMSLMLRASLPVWEAVQTLRDQAKNPRMKEILSSVLKDINQGSTLADALGKYQKDFSTLYINMIRIGEESGSLESNLVHLAGQMEKSEKLKKAVKGAMLYPAIIVIAAMGLGAVMSFMILPKLVTFFHGLNVELPLMTRILLKTADFSSGYGIFMLILPVAMLIAFKLGMKNPAFRLMIHSLLVKSPIIGPIMMKLNMAYFARTLATLLKSGVTIVDAIVTTGQVMNNLVYKRILNIVANKVKSGGTLAEKLVGNESAFPLMGARMIEVGERTGSLEETLFYLADYYEDEVHEQLKNISTIIEPILLIGIGLVVAFIAVAIITPIYSITQGLELG